FGANGDRTRGSGQLSTPLDDARLAERAVVAEAAAAAVPLAGALVHAQLAELFVVPMEQRRALRGSQIVACQRVLGVALELRAELRVGAGALDDLSHGLLRHDDPSESADAPHGAPYTGIGHAR